MKARTYFEKRGCIFGISRKFEFGKWTGYTKKFTNWNEAQEWLNTEEYDFRTRELVSESKAVGFDMRNKFSR